MSEPGPAALPLGKLPAEELARFLGGLPPDPTVVTGPGIGEDAAVLRAEAGALLIAAADPITFPTPRPGWSAVHVNANDVATRGGEPRWFLATLLLPGGSGPGEARRLLAEVAAACADVGARLVGGHTEISDAVARPVVAGCMLGAVPPGRLRRSGDGRAGDRLIVAGPIGVEGSGVLATAGAAALAAAGLAPRTIAAAAGLAERLGISVLPAARVAAPLAHALHDITEGGLATAVQELAEASGLGAELEAERAPLRPETLAVCRALDLDPLGLLSSGSLLIAAPPVAVVELLHDLAGAGIAAAECGRLTAERGQWLRRGGRRAPLPVFARDELARWLEGPNPPRPPSLGREEG